VAYKRYFYRNGKKFGPYYYESYRDKSGKVRKRYVGTKHPGEKKENKKITPTENKQKNQIKKSFLNAKKEIKRKVKKIDKKFLVIPLIILLFVGGVLFFMYFSQITGKMHLDIDNDVLSISLKKGVLLPINSKLIIGQGGVSKEVLLSELIDSNFEGSFYVEDLEISGEGGGYGIFGEKKFYPEVEFTLEIKDSEDVGGEVGSGGSGESESSEDIVVEEEVEEVEEEIIEESDEEVEEEDDEEIEEELSQIQEDEDVEQQEESEESEDSGEESEVESESSSESSESEDSGGESESSSESSESSESSAPSITGDVVKGKSKSKDIKGSCSKENKFLYELDEGKTVEIKKNSVKVERLNEDGKIKKEKISEDEIDLKIFGQEIEVTTDYYEAETGFGEDYLVDEEVFLEIDLSSLNISDEEVVISLVYEDVEIAEVSEGVEDLGDEVVEEEVEEENITEIVNETEMNITDNVEELISSSSEEEGSLRKKLKKKI